MTPVDEIRDVSRCYTTLLKCFATTFRRRWPSSWWHSLPLAMGIAVASGAPVVAGLTAAIVCAAVGGSPLQVSVAAFRAGHPVARAAAAAGFDDADQLSMVDVAVQVETLRAHPLVAPRLATGSVAVAGLFLELGSARGYLVGATDIAEISQDSTVMEGLVQVAR